MLIGLSLNNRGPGAATDSILTTAQAADRLGFHAVWVGDHVVIPEQSSSQYPYGPPGTFNLESRQTYFEALTTLAVVAGATQHVRLGTSVLIAPQRDPVLTGKQIATLDALSNGRVVIGVGVGWFREEFAALGMADRFDVRGAATDECIRVWRTLWTETTSQFEGQHYTVPPVRAFPKPTQRSGPPVVIGGNVRVSRRRAARLGDGWHAINLTLDELRAGIAELHDFVRAAGRQPGDVPVSLKLPARVGEPARSPHELGGSPAELRDRIAQLEQLGVAELCFDLVDLASSQPASVTAEAVARFADALGLKPRS